MQMALLVVEGVVLCFLAITYVWYLASKVGEQRYNIYNIFMAVPQGLVRQLATKRLNLSEEGDEEDVDDVLGVTPGGQGGGAGNTGGACELP